MSNETNKTAEKFLSEKVIPPRRITSDFVISLLEEYASLKLSDKEKEISYLKEQAKVYENYLTSRQSENEELKNEIIHEKQLVQNRNKALTCLQSKSDDLAEALWLFIKEQETKYPSIVKEHETRYILAKQALSDYKHK